MRAVKAQLVKHSNLTTQNLLPQPLRSSMPSSQTLLLQQPLRSKIQVQSNQNPPSLTAPEKQNSIAVKSNPPSKSFSFINSKDVFEVAKGYDRWSKKKFVRLALPGINLLEEIPVDRVKTILLIKITGLLQYRPEVSKDISQFIRFSPKMLPVYASFICDNINNQIGLCPLSRLCAIPLSAAIGKKFLLGDKYLWSCCIFFNSR